MFWRGIERRSPAILRAGPLTMDRMERLTTLSGRVLDLSPLLQRLLQHLAEQPGKLVTRPELKRILWPHAERIDTERRLNTAMRALRAALGDDADRPRFIETVRSYGYRWIIPNRPAGRPRIAPAVALLVGICFALSPPLTPAAPDLATALQAQSAMEQWRREPNLKTADRAAGWLSRAGVASTESPSLLAMKAELELGSQWHWSAADRDYQRALERDPTNADARLGLAWLRVNQGRSSEALGLVRSLVSDGVLSGDRRATLGWLMIRAGRPDLAALSCGRERSASVNDLACSAQALSALGRLGEAKSINLKLMERAAALPLLIARVRSSSPGAANRIFLGWRSRHFLPADASWFERAQVLADAGDTGNALKALERSVAAHEPMATKIYSTPAFVGLRRDPAYRALVRQVGLAV